MQKDFVLILHYVLQSEGGYTNDPADPGGPTNWGITIIDARKYWKSNATATDVKAMPQSVAEQIYKEKYWNAMNCDSLPVGVDYSIMDYGVNSGIGRAGKVLRRALKMSDTTSVISADVISACSKADPNMLINYINTERLAFLQSLKTWPNFGKGWGARVASVKARSLAMAQGATVIVDTPKPTEPSAKGHVTTHSAQNGSITGTVVTGGATAVATSHSWEVATIVICATVVIAFGVYLFFQWKQKQDQEKAVPIIVTPAAKA